MSIANDLNYVMRALGETLTRLAIFAERIPNERVSAATLSAKATTRQRRCHYLVLWLVVDAR